MTPVLRMALRWLVPLLVLLPLALIDGLVRTAALALFALVVAARVLIVALDEAREHAPVGPLAIGRVRPRGGAA